MNGHSVANIWWHGRCLCSICGHEQQTAIEIEPDLSEPIYPLECADCGNLTSHPVGDEPC